MLLLLQRSGLEHVLRPVVCLLRHPETVEILVRSETNASQDAHG